MVEPKIISADEDEYELMPRRDIDELKGELRKLKEFEITPTKKLHVSINELNAKIDKLIAIFEDAQRSVRSEEGGLGFAEKMKPLADKMNKILEQNADIAEGILSLADMITAMKEVKMEVHEEAPQMPQMGMPPMPPQMPQQRPRTFGL